MEWAARRGLYTFEPAERGVLSDAEEKYRTLFESIDEGFCVIEVLFDDRDHPIDYRFLEVNRVFEKQTGISNAVGRLMREIAPAHEEHWFRIYGQVALTGEPLRFENPAKALGRFYDVYAFRIGKPEQRRVAVLFNDITERKQAETERAQVTQELRQAQELLREDLDATNRLLKIGSLFLQEGNLESVLGEIVDAAIAITGADFGTVQVLDGLSGDLTIAAHRGLPAWWLEFWQRVDEGQGTCGTALEWNERVVVEDVETSPIFAGTPALEIQLRAGVRAVQSTPLRGRAGKPVGMLSTHFRRPGKVSHRALRLLDLLCRQAADILERAQAERALAEANERLLEADRRKDEFLGMLSHELRNPLEPVRQAIHILKEASPGSEPSLWAQRVIDRQVAHLSRLIDDLLDVTRITNGKIQLQRGLLDLNELTWRTLEDHYGAFVENGIELEMRAIPAAVWVNADRTRLSQVIGNLLQNAVKFTPRGGRTTVSVEASSSLAQAILRVRDTGRGIAAELLPRMFEAFIQAEVSLDRKKGGLGLGLAVVKALVEMHGGSVRCESEGLDKGATLTITLPLEPAGPTRAEPPRVRAVTKPRRVLIIEDNEDAADTLREVLKRAGHAVDLAHSGFEGLKIAKAFRPEVVLCDIGLPEMDGYEVARTLRAEAELVPLTLIALTGYARPDDVARAREAGFDAHLAKPVTIDTLDEALEHLGSLD